MERADDVELGPGPSCGGAGANPCAVREALAPAVRARYNAATKRAEDPGGWCEKHCRPEYPAARKECWREFLEKEYAREWAEAVKQSADR